MSLYRFTRGLRPSRLAPSAVLCVVLGLIIAVATRTLAQSPPEQFPSVSDKTTNADSRAGEDPVATPISTSDHTDSTKDNSGASDKDGAIPWMPTPTEKASLANRAPVLPPYFNNGPVFGIFGTEISDVWHRTQLTGDWGGLRPDLARHGLFFDIYSTTAYQDVASGGLKTGSAFIQNTQASINIDTGGRHLVGRIFHITLESRNGSSSPQQSFAVGSFRVCRSTTSRIAGSRSETSLNISWLKINLQTLLTNSAAANRFAELEYLDGSAMLLSRPTQLLVMRAWHWMRTVFPTTERMTVLECDSITTESVAR